MSGEAVIGKEAPATVSLCSDCGTDISTRHEAAYLCDSCKRQRHHARYERRMADPEMRERRRAKNREYARKHYQPRVPRTTIQPCQATGCNKTFVRVWHASTRMFCDGCRVFYANLANADSSKRRYAKKRAGLLHPAQRAAPN